MNMADKGNPKIYKYFLSVIFGLLGFVGSFFVVKFAFGNVNINIPWSLVFPLIITLAWGSRYGLISILCGLTIFYPFVIGAYNGYASIVPAFSLFIWITLVGAAIDRKKLDKKKHFSIYSIQLIYTFIRVILYFTAFPLLHQLNPPFWNPDAITAIEYSTITVFAIKSAVIDLLMLSVAEVLTHLPFMRKLLRLDCPSYMRFNTIIVISVPLLLLFITVIVMTGNCFLVHRHYLFEWLIRLPVGTVFVLFLIVSLGLIIGGIIARVYATNCHTIEQLKSSEQKYRAIFDNFNDIYLETGIEGTIYTISPSVTRMLGYKAEDLVGKNIAGLYELGMRTIIIKELLQVKKIDNIKISVKDTDKKIHDLLLNLEQTTLENGEIRIIGIARDVTQYFKTVEKLDEAEKKYSLLFEKMLNGLAIIEPIYDDDYHLVDYRYVDVNSSFESQTGRRREAVIGTLFSEFSGIKSQYLDIYEKVFKTGEPQSFIAYNLRNDDLYDSVHVFIVSHNQAVIMFENITERIAAENKFKMINTNLTSIIESTDDLIWSVDRDYRVVHFNTAFKKHIKQHFNTDVAPGMPLYEMLGGRTGIMKDIFDRAVREGRYRTDYESADGLRTFSMSLNPLCKDGECYEITVFSRDITQRIKMENEILQLNAELEARVDERTEALKNALQELESFTYTVSHDLKSPMRQIDAYSTILLEEHPQINDSQIGATIRKIQVISSDMALFIDKLLSYSRVAQHEANKEYIDLYEMICTVFNKLTQIQDREIELVIDDDIPKILTDRFLLRQVLTVVLSNAVKFTRKRQNAVITVKCDISGHELIVCISDNGVGFDPLHAHKLFNMYQRLHSLYEYEGAGIGLATVKKLIQKLGGRAWITGERDKGTEVFFTLPLLENTENKI